jgi:hypothetical protein
MGYHMRRSRHIELSPLEREVAMMLCQSNRHTRDMPSEDELQHQLKYARMLIKMVREDKSR